ncbi:MAG: 1-deoxy-D-xylulose-5-phosphate reductoisomerase, partial [Syntrophomonadaceae bacterium]|nr:1-deoxy-D-xylulose-5-phosphate reductoisomerase [Syntrophomonadaceae bacterium]
EKNLEKIWLTASGGPFRDFSEEQMKKVTVEMALKHPNWHMGPKITVDSASLMNKGLEVIEAHHLFHVDYERIKVVIHQESIVHSLIELTDGSFLAHLGRPDMKIPIQYALTYPDRRPIAAEKLDLTALGAVHFGAPDTERFPCLRLAYEAGKTGGTMPAVMNAANETAVGAFLNQELEFFKIPQLIDMVMTAHDVNNKPNLSFILEADRWAREYCRHLIGNGV